MSKQATKREMSSSRWGIMAHNNPHRLRNPITTEHIESTEIFYSVFSAFSLSPRLNLKANP